MLHRAAALLHLTLAPPKKNSTPIPQEDNLLPILNVAETCRLYANLTLPRNTSPDQAAARVEEVLHAMVGG
jgi:ABC-type multidrug transport system ATPase subunit